MEEHSTLLESIRASIARTRLPPEPLSGETLRREAPSEQPPGEASKTAELPLLAVAAPDAPELPFTAGSERLAVEKELGRGGMGVVYLATQRSLGRRVALKVAEGGAQARASLLREARVMGQLEHPNIVPVHLLGVDEEGAPTLVLKRIEGVSWATLLKKPTEAGWGALAERYSEELGRHLEVLVQVSHAVQYAHARGVVHRDLKPENVMVGEHGEVYLLDWGIALPLRERAQEEPAVVGTPAYMAPEMALGRPALVDERTDVYLLGALLHRVLTGRPRHEGRSIQEVLGSAAQSEGVEYGASVPAELARLCNDATARDPALRPATAAAFRRRVLEYLSHRVSLSLSATCERELESATSGALGSLEQSRVLTQCRFGFLEALREWDGNLAAKRGLRRVREVLLERALTLRDAEGARAALEELGSEGGEHEARIVALEAALREERAQAEANARRRRELDLTSEARWRNMVLAALASGIVLLGATLFLRSRQAGVPPTYPQVLGGDALIIASALAVMFALRKRIFANEIGRRLNATLLACMGSTASVDVVSCIAGAPVPLSASLRCAVGAVVVGLASRLGLPALWLPALQLLLGSVALALWPAQAAALHPLALAVTTLTVAWQLGTGQLRASREELPE